MNNNNFIITKKYYNYYFASLSPNFLKLKISSDLGFQEESIILIIIPSKDITLPLLHLTKT